MFKDPEYNNSPINYTQDKPPEFLHLNPITHIKGSKIYSKNGHYMLIELSKSEYYIYSFLLYKSNAQNQFTFSKDLFLKYRGFIEEFICKPYPSQRKVCHRSYFKFKEAIISLLDKHFVLKYDENGAKMMINPSFAYAPYCGTPGLCAKFTEEYNLLMANNQLTTDNISKICNEFAIEAKKKVLANRPVKK